MSLKLDRPIVFLDLEATGVDVQRDRIIQVACVRVHPDSKREVLESLVDPQIPIPAEATAVHGLRDADVRGQPTFRDLAPRLLDFLGEADLGGFGICRFDLPMLAAEFKRAGFSFEPSARRSVDAMLIFHRMEPRSLSAAMRFYCGRTLENAHSARADAEASMEVLLAQVERYGARPGSNSSPGTAPEEHGVGARPGSNSSPGTAPEEHGVGARPALPCDVQGLHEFCNAPDPRNVDSKGKFVWRHGLATFNFGKHQTRALEEVVRIDRSYIEWLVKAESTTPEVAEICRKALVGSFPRQPPKAGAGEPG